jgi:hypothetical protein
MVVKRTEYATRLDRHHAHAKLAPSHPFNLRAKVNRCKQLHRYPFVSGATSSLFIVVSLPVCLRLSSRAVSSGVPHLLSWRWQQTGRR